MQIDNVQSTKIDTLAVAAAEKMLNHLNNSTSIFKNLKAFAYNPIGVIGDIFSTKEPDDENYVAQLLEGITKGKAVSGEEVISTKNSRERLWIADDVFEKPAITSDGEYFYCTNTSEPEIYGAKYISFIPSEYKEKKLDIDTRNRIQPEFIQHKKLVDLSDRIAPENKKENLLKDIVVDQANFAKDKRKARQSFIAGVAGSFLGAMSVYAAGILGLSSSLGFHPVIAIPVAAAIGVSTSVIIPIAITICVVIGAGLMISGIKTAVSAANKLEKIERHHIKVVTEIQEIRSTTHAKEINLELKWLH